MSEIHIIPIHLNNYLKVSLERENVDALVAHIGFQNARLRMFSSAIMIITKIRQVSLSKNLYSMICLPIVEICNQKYCYPYIMHPRFATQYQCHKFVKQKRQSVSVVVNILSLLQQQNGQQNVTQFTMKNVKLGQYEYSRYIYIHIKQENF